MKFSSSFALLTLFGGVASQEYPLCDESQRKQMPNFCSLLDFASSDPSKLADELFNSPFAAIQKELDLDDIQTNLKASDNLPIVVAHGMGDSCFNRGMKSIVSATSKKTGSYATCIPTGTTRIKDTINGFLLNMDASVDVFAEGVKNDPSLSQGFNAYGLSQGNNLIRGYIQKYHTIEGYPKVNTFMSICGINAGVGAFPSCAPDEHGICKGLTEVLGDLAYNEFVQGILFQANYFRDPSKTDSSAYKKHSQLAQWENEGDDVQESRKEGFGMTEKYVWVIGTEDTVVWPREGEIWGAMDPEDPFKTKLAYNETKWYKEDTFGLRTADEEGKNNWESFDGEHIQFTQAELMGWLEKYFM